MVIVIPAKPLIIGDIINPWDMSIPLISIGFNSIIQCIYIVLYNVYICI